VSAQKAYRALSDVCSCSRTADLSHQTSS